MRHERKLILGVVAAACWGGSGCPARTVPEVRERPVAGREFRRVPQKPIAPQVRFVVDELWLAVYMVAYYDKLHQRLGIRKSRRSRWRHRKSLRWPPPGAYRMLKAKYFTDDTKDAAAFVKKAMAISATWFHTLRGSHSIGPLAKRWKFWTPAATTIASLRAYHPDMPGYVKQLRGLKEFKTIVAQTRKRKAFCEKQWKQNLKRSTRIMTSLTGLAFKRCVTVYISYPGMPGGRYQGRKGPKDCPYAIMWGGREDFSDFTTVYIWHELLHSYFPNGQLEHAVIQLLTDNELRVRLAGDKRPYPPYVGHQRLVPWMLWLRPAWKRYLSQKGQRDIRTFVKKARSLSYPAR